MTASIVTVEDLCLQYNQKQAGSRSDRYRCAQLARNAIGAVKIADLNVADLSRLRDERLGQGLSAQTIHHDINMLRRLIRVARTEWGAFHIPDHKETFALLRMPMIQGERDRRLRSGEWEALWKEADDVMRMGLVIAIETAMRRGEICALQWRMIDFDRRTISLPRQITKTRRDRKVPMSLPVTNYLAANRRDLGAVIGLTVSAFKQRWERLRARAAETCPSVASFRFHDLRHECLSRLAEAGWTLPKLRVMSGHADYRMLQRYINLRAEDLVAELDGSR